VIGGWTVSGIFNWHSGFPWSPSYNTTCNLIYAKGACTNGGSTQLAPVAYLGGASSDQSNSAFLRHGGNFPNGSTAYFTAPTFTACALPFPQVCPGAPQAPGIERNSLRGPGYKDVDATISKAFGLPKMPVLGENAQFEFRANFYNLFNNLNLDVNQINKVIANWNPSTQQFVQNSTFGTITGSPGAFGGRTIELQARFSF
jgi:hypothetical protein